MWHCTSSDSLLAKSSAGRIRREKNQLLYVSTFPFFSLVDGTASFLEPCRPNAGTYYQLPFVLYSIHITDSTLLVIYYYISIIPVTFNMHITHDLLPVYLTAQLADDHAGLWVQMPLLPNSFYCHLLFSFPFFLPYSLGSWLHLYRVQLNLI